MTTRLSKIARLPANIREQLNRRLHNGELSRTILPWLNELPETKKVLAKLFGASRITHQNLSEWRYAGYQDWLFLQQRLQWCESLTEQETEINKNKCGDAYETIGWHFLFEISQALNALQCIKNPQERSVRLQNLTREFARLQNAFNWSRRVHLEWNKYNDQDQSQSPPPPPPAPQIEEDDDDDEKYYEDDDEDNIDQPETDETGEIEEPATDQAAQTPSHAGTTSPSPLRSGGEGRGEEAHRVHGEETNPIAASSSEPAPNPNITQHDLPRRSAAEAGTHNTPAPQPNSQPIPTLAPTPHTPATLPPTVPPPVQFYTDNPNVPRPDPRKPLPPQPRSTKYQYYSLRSILGRRFRCVEG